MWDYRFKAGPFSILMISAVTGFFLYRQIMYGAEAKRERRKSRSTQALRRLEVAEKRVAESSAQRAGREKKLMEAVETGAFR